MSVRRRLARLLVGAASVAAVAVIVVPPATAQDDGTRSPLETTNWSASFNDSLAAGATEVTGSQRLAVSGTFTYKGTGFVNQLRDLASVTAEASTPNEPVPEGCAAPSLTNATDTAVDKRQRNFGFTVESQCNLVVRVTATGTTTPVGGSATTARMYGDVTFAVPAVPVTALAASVPDLDSREVTVAWEKPEGSAVDATYTVQRLDPDADAWTDIGTDTELVDEVDDVGAYKYRVTARRPHTDPVHSAPVDAYVGVEPPTTTVPDDDETETPTTVTMPDSEAPITTPGRSSSTGGRRVSSRTQVTTAPRVTVTTIDTGFEETLDYDLDDIEPGELAAEGQSILSSEPESGVIGPGAVGASVLVMAGWAGHYLYFRRLAAQF